MNDDKHHHPTMSEIQADAHAREQQRLRDEEQRKKDHRLAALEVVGRIAVQRLGDIQAALRGGLRRVADGTDEASQQTEEAMNAADAFASAALREIGAQTGGGLEAFQGYTAAELRLGEENAAYDRTLIRARRWLGEIDEQAAQVAIDITDRSYTSAVSWIGKLRTTAQTARSEIDEVRREVRTPAGTRIAAAAPPAVAESPVPPSRQTLADLAREAESFAVTCELEGLDAAEAIVLLQAALHGAPPPDGLVDEITSAYQELRFLVLQAASAGGVEAALHGQLNQVRSANGRLYDALHSSRVVLRRVVDEANRGFGDIVRRETTSASELQQIARAAIANLERLVPHDEGSAAASAPSPPSLTPQQAQDRMAEILGDDVVDLGDPADEQASGSPPPSPGAARQCGKPCPVVAREDDAPHCRPGRCLLSCVREPGHAGACTCDPDVASGRKIACEHNGCGNTSWFDGPPHDPGTFCTRCAAPQPADHACAAKEASAAAPAAAGAPA